jgi:hypothetical protein
MIKVSLKRPQSGAVESVKLGGIVIYGRTMGQITDEIDRVGKAIAECGKAHLSATRPVLQKLVSEMIGQRLEKRLFGAILGSRIRMAEFAVLLCEAEQGSGFRIFVHITQLGHFRTCMGHALQMLRDARSLIVKDLEGRIFPMRAYNTWSSASHLLARHVFEGRAEYVDQMTFRYPPPLRDAIYDTGC